MRSYLEITWLLNTTVCAGAWSLTSVLYDKTTSRIKLFSCAVICTCLCWMIQKLKWTCFLHLFFGIVLYGRSFVLAIQASLMISVSLHLLDNLDCFVVQNGLLYCDAASGKWLIVLVIVILIIILEPGVPVLKKQSELYVPVHLAGRTTSFDCIGYLDTGNCAMHPQLPVVFVRNPVECGALISVQSVTGEAFFKAEKARLSMEDRAFDVMMAYVPDLQVECLLHVMMK